jgi:G3E family GTPase
VKDAPNPVDPLRTEAFVDQNLDNQLMLNRVKGFFEVQLEHNDLFF